MTDFLGSAVIAAIVAGAVSLACGSMTALVSLRASERQIQIENITQERAKWRDKIRAKSVEVCLACSAQNADELEKLRLEFALNLNPLEPEDRAILGVIGDLAKGTQNIEVFSDRVSLLLKHDWERAKLEAKPWAWYFLRRLPPSMLRFLSSAANRVSYEEFKTTAAVVANKTPTP